MHKRYLFKNAKNAVPMSNTSVMARDSFMLQSRDTLEPLSCFVCDAVSFRLISQVDRYGFYYPTGICNCCGNVQQSEYYNEATLTEFYTSYYRAIYGGTPPDDLHDSQKSGNGLDIFRFVSTVSAPKTVLEVGCAAGGILKVFKDNGCKTLGLDFDDDYLQVARNNGIQTCQGSLEQLDDNDKFDLIILSHVLEHIVDPHSFLKSLTTKLTADGVIYIEVPSLNAVSAGASNSDLLTYWQNAHVTHFSVKSLTLLCSRVGLRKVKMTDCIRSCWTFSGEVKALDDEAMLDCYNDTVRMLEHIETQRSAFNMKNVKLFFIKLSINWGVYDVLRLIYHKVKVNK